MTRSTFPTCSPPKATLFCPECGHRSRYDGDWLVTETDSGRRYRCPECRATVTVRPTFGGDGSSDPPAAAERRRTLGTPAPLE
jgi:DNA-directed RNA polymerase subunit RPC12/RpoP